MGVPPQLLQAVLAGPRERPGLEERLAGFEEPGRRYLSGGLPGGGGDFRHGTIGIDREGVRTGIVPLQQKEQFLALPFRAHHMHGFHAAQLLANQGNIGHGRQL